ncbi:MAG: hypothetical protein NVSMB26_15650 [Beijerinckiaceae bacterium]
MGVGKVSQGIMRDEGCLARDDGREAMVHHPQVEALQVRNVAWYVKRKYLALAVRQDFVATEETFNDEAALGRPISLANEVLVGSQLLDRDRQGENCLLLPLGQGGNALELSKKPVKGGSGQSMAHGARTGR